MSRSRCLVALAGVAMLAAALPAAALPAVTPAARAPATHASATSLLSVFTDYADRGETQIFDAVTRRLLSSTTKAPKPRAEGANAEGAAVTGPSSAQRCSNAGSYDEFDAGYPRPWRLSEPFHVNSSGAPSSRVGDWRNQIVEGKRVW